LSTIPARTLDEGRKQLGELIIRLAPLGQLSNEAETRFHFIDGLLIECLGWEKEDIHVEIHEDGDYADYEIGRPTRALIVEAKKAGLQFIFPAEHSSKRPIVSLAALLEADAGLEAAVRQCQDYCVRRGVQYAVVCNGSQIIAFLASRSDGIAPLKGKALAINGESQLVANFTLLWQHLSPWGVDDKRLSQLLSAGASPALPRKLTSLLLEYPKFRYRSRVQEELRTVADLLLEDVTLVPEVEPEFYRQCYCESGALSSFAILSKGLINARYAALFDTTADAPQISPVTEGSGNQLSASNAVAEAIAKRPIVLIGDVGVGKTSFFKHLIYVRAAAEFGKSIYVYIDLGSQGALENDLKDFVLDEIERQLFSRYAIDIQQKEFVRGVYDLEVKRFRGSVWGDIYDTDRNQYEQKLREHLSARVANKASHVQQSVRHIARGRKTDIIVILDNADQRDLDVQQSAFLIAQNFAREWDAIVFIAVRPQTFHQSKRAGALSAYPPKVFSISPPRPELLIRKRLVFALDMAEGRLPVERLHGLRLNLNGLSLFLKALLSSLERSKDIPELLSNITGGNMRSVVELITRFISTPNVDSDKIIRIMNDTGRYDIPLHEFAKVAILGDYAHFNPASSIALNVFDVSFPDPREHFLALLLLGYLNYDGAHRNLEQFVRSDSLVSEMQDWGFIPLQVLACLRRLTNKKLIETTERVTFDEDVLGNLIGDMPSAFRITTVGAYHLLRWAGSFAYLDAMAFDTPIFSDEAMKLIAKNPGSFDIVDRFERTIAFREYLNEVWKNAALSPAYFDWGICINEGDRDFASVKQAIGRMGRSANNANRSPESLGGTHG
jgi:GTPase SAR1 family protein